jgi:predicted metalloprotease with PDZ domain
VAESSLDAWSGYFGHNEHQLNTGVSFYDKGCALAVLLDFAIRHETKGEKSLDDVMRTLYRTYYKEKKRGFTDAEFREVCERIAGAPLREIFEVYVRTPSDIDYPRYVAWAGLSKDDEILAVDGARTDGRKRVGLKRRLGSSATVVPRSIHHANCVLRVVCPTVLPAVKSGA